MSLWPFALLAVTSLLAIMNPLSVAPVYLALTADYTPEHRRRTLLTALFTAAGVLVTFTLLGGAIFRVFGITLEAFRIAGGVILFGIGMDMLKAQRSRTKSTREEEEESLQRSAVGVFPLGVPLIVGPGAITTVMVLVGDAATVAHVVVLFAAIALALAVTHGVLLLGPRLVQWLGQTGLNVVTRIMGLLLTVVATQFVIDGVRPLLTSILRQAGGGG